MKQSRIGYLFVAPALVHLLIFALFPLIFTLYISFFRWNLITEDKEFLGLGNYAYSFEDSLFWNAMWNSVKFAALSVPLGMLIGLGVALLVNQRLRGVTIFRVIYYIPAISSGVAVTMLWTYMYLPNTGLINTFLGSLGIDAGTDFLTSE